ncbi:limbic system-associated membrane protein-like [Penaeus indicus]|uniref:limbic system-associated membrane protein-like n=1 Tax=Penaeus indicus TaxID=29960 RepID=UPI00300C108C
MWSSDAFCGFLGVLVLALPCMVLGGSTPQFAAPIQNITVAAGRDARLSCVVENLGDNKVAWTYVGKTGTAVLTINSVVLTQNQRVSVLRERGGLSWSLIIANVSKLDQGDYVCQINTVPQQKMYTHISVVVPPIIPSPPNDVIANEGEGVTLECSANGDPEPTLTWRREDGASFSLNRSQVVDAASGPRLTLAPVTRDAAGAFLCVATNGVPPAVSARTQLFVKYAPEVGGGTGVVWAKPPTPPPSPSPITITKLCSPATPSDGARDDSDLYGNGTSILVLKNVGPENFGHYRCSVTNELGQDSVTLTLVAHRDHHIYNHHHRQNYHISDHKLPFFIL